MESPSAGRAPPTGREGPPCPGRPGRGAPAPTRRRSASERPATHLLKGDAVDGHVDRLRFSACSARSARSAIATYLPCQGSTAPRTRFPSIPTHRTRRPFFFFFFFFFFCPGRHRPRAWAAPGSGRGTGWRWPPSAAGSATWTGCAPPSSTPCRPAGRWATTASSTPSPPSAPPSGRATHQRRTCAWSRSPTRPERPGRPTGATSRPTRPPRRPAARRTPSVPADVGLEEEAVGSPGAAPPRAERVAA